MPNFHPILVHFTVALFVTSVVFDLIGYFTGRETFKAAGRWNLILAGAFAIPTVITGLIAEATLPHTDEAHRLMEIHEVLGFVVLGTLIFLAVWRIMKSAPAGKTAALYLVIGIAGLGVMTAGAYYGGEMVYTHGMGVLPMMEQMAKGHDSGGHEHSGTESADAGEHHGKMSEEADYSCSMHPEVVSDKPGSCPKCGMTLQENSKGGENGDETMHDMPGKPVEKKAQHGDDNHDH